MPPVIKKSLCDNSSPHCNCDEERRKCKLIPVFYRDSSCINAVDSADEVSLGQSKLYVKNGESCDLHTEYISDKSSENAGKVCFYNYGPSCWTGHQQIFADKACESVVTSTDQAKGLKSAYWRDEDGCKVVKGYDASNYISGSGYDGGTDMSISWGSHNYKTLSSAKGPSVLTCVEVQPNATWKQVLHEDCSIPQHLTTCDTTCGMAKGSAKCSTEVYFDGGSKKAAADAYCNRVVSCPSAALVKTTDWNGSEVQKPKTDVYMHMNGSYCGRMDTKNMGASGM